METTYTWKNITMVNQVWTQKMCAHTFLSFHKWTYIVIYHTSNRFNITENCLCDGETLDLVLTNNTAVDCSHNNIFGNFTIRWLQVTHVCTTEKKKTRNPSNHTSHGRICVWYGYGYNRFIRVLIFLFIEWNLHTHPEKRTFFS